MRRPLLFLNLAHAYDHFFLLILPTAVLALAPAWGMSYGEALALGTAAFVMFGLGTLPAGWLGDRWSRTHLMSIFFVGIGLASILVGLAPGPLALTLGLGLLGLFASIYHPVGTALVVQNARRTGQSLGVNGVFGNLGVAAAGLVTGLITEFLGWRAAFILPGMVAVLTGIVFWRYVGPAMDEGLRARPAARPAPAAPSAQLRVFAVVGVTALFGGIIFHGTTVALPKVFEERLAGLVDDIATIGLLVALVFALAAIAQIAVGRLLDRYGARLILPLIVVPQVACLLLAVELSGWSMLLLDDGADAAGVRRDPDHRLAGRAVHREPLAVARVRLAVRALARRQRARGAADRGAARAHRRLRGAVRRARRRRRPGGARLVAAARAAPRAGRRRRGRRAGAQSSAMKLA